jgi:septum site-determining protein MinC
VELLALLSTNEATLAAAQALELFTDLNAIPTRSRGLTDTNIDPEEEEGYVVPPMDSEEYGTGGVLIKRTLRSGRTVHNIGHVVIIGDVNSGAEVIASGDIIVWGKVRGVVHAGAQGDENAVVCALDLAPTQLRIAGLITVPPKDKRRNPRPEMARVNHGQIEAIPWEA